MPIDFLVVLFFFILGAIVGSFLNVLILKYNTGRTAGGRSSCMSCLRTLEWYELVPILSFFFLRGRCRTCTSKLSWQYPLVELSSGLLFAFTYSMDLPITSTLFVLLVATLFLFIVVYDLRHMIIPEVPMYVLIAVSFAALFFDPVLLSLHMPNWWDAAMGPLLFFFFTALFVATQGRGVGFGDAKLSLAIGFLLGFPEAFSALLLSFWIGAGVGIVLLLWSHFARRIGHKRMLYFSYVPQFLWHSKSEIPFAPFLALGTFLVYFFDVSVLFL